jgi:hypothetical protein
MVIVTTISIARPAKRARRPYAGRSNNGGVSVWWVEYVQVQRAPQGGAFVYRLLSDPEPTAKLAGLTSPETLEEKWDKWNKVGQRPPSQLSIYDIDLNDGTLTVRKGKGGRDRVVPLGKVATQYLREYLGNVRPKMMARMPHPDAVERLLFSAQRHPLHPQMLYHLVRKSRSKAGLPHTTSTHSLRHTCATEMLRGGASIRHVQEMLGHSQITTTQVYTRVVPSDLQKVHAKTSPSERLKKIDAPTFTFTGMWHESTPHGPRKRRRGRR